MTFATLLRKLLIIADHTAEHILVSGYKVIITNGSRTEKAQETLAVETLSVILKFLLSCVHKQFVVEIN